MLELKLKLKKTFHNEEGFNYNKMKLGSMHILI